MKFTINPRYILELAIYVAIPIAKFNIINFKVFFMGDNV